MSPPRGAWFSRLIIATDQGAGKRRGAGVDVRQAWPQFACVERDFAIWKELTIDFRGRTVSGSYSTSREGLVTVKTLRGSKIATLGGSNVRLFARILLRELAAEGKA
jgi:hypothetical protein